MTYVLAFLGGALVALAAVYIILDRAVRNALRKF